MRTIEFEQVRRTVESLCIAACYELPDDVRAALEAAAAKESNPPAAKILAQLLDNARIAADERIPLCQDTGLTVVFVEQGAELVLTTARQDGPVTLHEAVNEGVGAGYENGFLRKSVVADPLHARDNTQTNAPAILHHLFVPGDRLKITVMAKGGGCENKSLFRMFRPTAEASDVADWIVEVVEAAGAEVFMTRTELRRSVLVVSPETPEELRLEAFSLIVEPSLEQPDSLLKYRVEGQAMPAEVEFEGTLGQGQDRRWLVEGEGSFQQLPVRLLPLLLEQSLPRGGLSGRLSAQGRFRYAGGRLEIDAIYSGTELEFNARGIPPSPLRRALESLTEDRERDERRFRLSVPLDDPRVRWEEALLEALSQKSE